MLTELNTFLRCRDELARDRLKMSFHNWVNELLKCLLKAQCDYHYVDLEKPLCSVYCLAENTDLTRLTAICKKNNYAESSLQNTVLKKCEQQRDDALRRLRVCLEEMEVLKQNRDYFLSISKDEKHTEIFSDVKKEDKKPEISHAATRDTREQILDVLKSLLELIENPSNLHPDITITIRKELETVSGHLKTLMEENWRVQYGTSFMEIDELDNKDIIISNQDKTITELHNLVEKLQVESGIHQNQIYNLTLVKSENIEEITELQRCRESLKKCLGENYELRKVKIEQKPTTIECESKETRGIRHYKLINEELNKNLNSLREKIKTLEEENLFIQPGTSSMETDGLDKDSIISSQRDIIAGLREMVDKLQVESHVFQNQAYNLTLVKSENIEEITELQKCREDLKRCREEIDTLKKIKIEQKPTLQTADDSESKEYRERRDYTSINEALTKKLVYARERIKTLEKSLIKRELSSTDSPEGDGVSLSYEKQENATLKNEIDRLNLAIETGHEREKELNQDNRVFQREINHLRSIIDQLNENFNNLKADKTTLAKELESLPLVKTELNECKNERDSTTQSLMADISILREENRNERCQLKILENEVEQYKLKIKQLESELLLNNETDKPDTKKPSKKRSDTELEKKEKIIQSHRKDVALLQNKLKTFNNQRDELEKYKIQFQQLQSKHDENKQFTQTITRNMNEKNKNLDSELNKHKELVDTLHQKLYVMQQTNQKLEREIQATREDMLKRETQTQISFQETAMQSQSTMNQYFSEWLSECRAQNEKLMSENDRLTKEMKECVHARNNYQKESSSFRKVFDIPLLDSHLIDFKALKDKVDSGDKYSQYLMPLFPDASADIVGIKLQEIMKIYDTDHIDRVFQLNKSWFTVYPTVKELDETTSKMLTAMKLYSYSSPGQLMADIITLAGLIVDGSKNIKGAIQVLILTNKLAGKEQFLESLAFLRNVYLNNGKHDLNNLKKEYKLSDHIDLLHLVNSYVNKKRRWDVEFADVWLESEEEDESQEKTKLKKSEKDETNVPQYWDEK